MSHRLLPPGLFLLALALPACSGTGSGPTITTVCARPGIPSIVAEIRDSEGQPAAVGATVTLRHGGGYEDAEKGFDDPLRIAAGEGGGGTFEVEVSKPWHTSATARNVEVAQDWCGVNESTRIELTLALQPGAPPVRQVLAPPSSFSFGWGNLKHHLQAKVVAAPGVSREVFWLARDTTVIQLLPDGSLTTKCRSVHGTTWAVAFSRADPARQDSTKVTVYADLNPTRCPTR